MDKAGVPQGQQQIESDHGLQLQRRSLLKAGAVLAGASLLPRFGFAADTGVSPREYAALDATAMAQEVRRGAISAEELLAAALQRCDAVNPKVNAVVMRHDDYARSLIAARRSQGLIREGALAGVPMLVKDLNTFLTGTSTSNGSRFFKDAPPAKYTSTLIARYEAAGALAFGKTAVPEFGLTTTTESQLWGQTRNPWNLAHSAGGSSGGAAAAVAAGIIPAAHATDGGGSIRIPASYCGLFGLKPSRYRTPSGPGKFESWFGASVAHVVSRSVRDSALLLDVGQGHEPGSPYWLPPLERPFVDEVGRAPGKLRVALLDQSLTGLALDADIRRVLDETVKLLLSLGHEIEQIPLPVQPQQVFGAQGAVTGTALLTSIRDREQLLGRSAGEGDLEQVTRKVLERAQGVTGEGLYRARQSFEAVSLAMEALFERFDVILSPVTATLTPELGKLRLSQPWDDYASAATGSAAFTVVANVSGQPAMSVPSGWSTSGLPVGMMYTARLGGEGLLLRLAGQLERERPWQGRRAAV
ncbi:amidase [Geopseudomonas sagittaria]|uniref:Amidase n=1 Tax=Geopseudomonas sagittaria TaxID=1135990 RepID=A0A1I5R0K7_9GAMM|nr:amidase [Pseudomonas sagittaria]MCM2331685.1 amidase [Pseudomonas sagittaria]SFP52048.1 amidase [Pseudomonas sagittaria]